MTTYSQQWQFVASAVLFLTGVAMSPLERVVEIAGLFSWAEKVRFSWFNQRMIDF
jgi:hypothetical protein